MTHDFKAAYEEFSTSPFAEDNIDAATEALRIMTLVQDGTHKIVPVDPTEEMCFAGTGFAENCVRAGGWYEAGMELSRDVYKAMLAAAPDHVPDTSKVVFEEVAPFGWDTAIEWFNKRKATDGKVGAE